MPAKKKSEKLTELIPMNRFDSEEKRKEVQNQKRGPNAKGTS